MHVCVKKERELYILIEKERKRDLERDREKDSKDNPSFVGFLFWIEVSCSVDVLLRSGSLCVCVSVYREGELWLFET